MLKNIAKSLILPINPSGIVLLGAYTVLWGFWLANPWWSVFFAADLYSEMSQLAPEWVWGTVAMMAGLCILYGAFSPSYRNLLFGSAVGGAHWMMLSVFYFAGDWQNTGGITSLFIGLYSAFIFTNVRVNKLGTGDSLDEDIEHVLD